MDIEKQSKPNVYPLLKPNSCRILKGKYIYHAWPVRSIMTLIVFRLILVEYSMTGLSIVLTLVYLFGLGLKVTRATLMMNFVKIQIIRWLWSSLFLLSFYLYIDWLWDWEKLCVIRLFDPVTGSGVLAGFKLPNSGGVVFNGGMMSLTNGGW